MKQRTVKLILSITPLNLEINRMIKVRLSTLVKKKDLVHAENVVNDITFIALRHLL